MLYEKLRSIHQSNEKHLTTLLEEKGREEAEREEDEKKKRWARGRTKETQILIVACEQDTQRVCANSCGLICVDILTDTLTSQAIYQSTCRWNAESDETTNYW